MAKEKFSLAASTRTGGSRLPNRVGLYGVEGVGKTSLACQGGNPYVMMSRGETGVETLIDSLQLSPVAHAPEIMTWADTLAVIKALREEEHNYNRLVMDAAGGFERLCHEHICALHFGGDWGDKGFSSYMQGYDVALASWREMLSLLDALRVEKGMGIWLLAHAKINTFKNPSGADYDRFTTDMHHKTWSITSKWLDMILFANFKYEVVATSKQKGAKAKASGDVERVLYCERGPTFDAKNRHGLPAEISMGDSPEEGYSNLVESLKKESQS